MPGWTGESSASGLFDVADFGRPFESNMIAEVESESPGCTKLRFSLRAKPAVPLIFFLGLVLSVWPGVWLTDSMLRSYFTGYDYKTWMWYLPMTVPFVPWGMWSAWKKSRASAFNEALDILDKISAIVDGRLVEAPARSD